MNASRQALCWSWCCTLVGFCGTDARHLYEVLRIGASWRVHVDGAPLRFPRGDLVNVIRTFTTANSACFHAELEAERRDVARAVAS